MADATDHIRRLADLFLTKRDRPDDDAVESTAVAPSAATAVIVECILVGHLPVRAGLWLTQYADDVAREQGPTGLLRLDADQVILEVLRGSEEVARVSTAATIRAALDATSSDVHRWIIRPQTGADVAQIVGAQPDKITILSGADEVAVVAAYRAIKDLYETAERSDRDLPRIEIAILGADADAAKRAAGKIAATAHESLGVAVTFGRSVQAMGPLGSTLHFRFPSEGDCSLGDLVSTIRDDATGRTPHPFETAPDLDTRPVLTLATNDTLDDDLDAMQDHDEDMSTMQDHTTTPTVTVPEFATAVESMAFTPPRPPAATEEHEEPAAQVRMKPKPAVHVEPKRIVPHPVPKPAPTPTALATWVDGLATLPVRCPDATDVEFAVDTHGHLHLAAWVDQLRLVAIAASWVSKHRELVRMACSEHTILESGDITTHIFTADPRKVCDLYGSGVKLHVLAPVKVDGKQGWYTAPLNV